MKMLFITFYFEPDLSAGSFRNTSLFNEIKKQIKSGDSIEVITTQPNRYESYNIDADTIEESNNIIIRRLKIPKHKNGILSQIKTFRTFYFEALNLTKNKKYDIVYASSSRLFSAFLGARIANKMNAKLYLDIRDIFRENMLEIYKNPILRLGLNIFLYPIEKYTFNSAKHINLVSNGFRSYFSKYKAEFTFFTNGIDDIFLNLHSNQTSVSVNDKKLILYAGNVGEGQGLDLIIPALAKGLGDNYKFKIIGDGGVKFKLVSEIEKQGIKNVELLAPVSRERLIEEYDKADFLFIHLNKYKAFEKVLPSKLFEYACFNKPIIAGVGGYAAEFLRENVENSIIFEPGNSEMLIFKIKEYKYKIINRASFIQKYSRGNINEKMAKSIISL